MSKATSRLAAIAFGAAVSVNAPFASALVITQDTNGADLTNALVTNSSQFTSISGSYTTGAASQIGLYTGFSSPPVTIGNGIVLSTGNAVDAVGPASASNNPSTDLGGGSTPALDAYAAGHVTGWTSSHDAAVFSLSFGLASPSAVAFKFIFGSIEFPDYVNLFADAFLAFLDGQQITFDSNGNPVDVGTSFSSLLTQSDTNTAFAGVHGLVGPLQTTSGELLAGLHTLDFVIADTNDGILDSAVFLSDFQTTQGGGGPITGAVPEPASLATFGMSVLLFGLLHVRKRRTRRAMADS